MEIKIELLRSQVLKDFPSGSSINYRDEKLYIVGDDANHILILDKDYREIDSIVLFESAEKRIPKSEKTDLEAACFITMNGACYLLVLGSASKKKRRKIILVPFSSKELDFSDPQFYVLESKEFIKRIKSKGIEEVNMEGATVIGNNLVLGNRGNRGNSANHIIVTDKDFWARQKKADLSVLPLTLPDDQGLLGVSELCYVESQDMLLLTLSSESTDNAIDDGVIGNSYLGLVKKIKHKIDHSDIVLNELINLGDVHEDLKNEKIEGVCVETVTDTELILHLVSDNDLGESKLFKIRVEI